MEQLFLTILNRAVTAGWLVLLVMVLRVVLKKAPRAAHYGLWAIVAVRLLWPGDLLPRAGVSLVPTTEPISGDVLTAAGTAVSGGLPAVGSPAGAAAAETAARMNRDGLLEECAVRLEPGNAEIAMEPTPEGRAKAEAVMEMLRAGAELLEEMYGQYVVMTRA